MRARAARHRLLSVMLLVTTAATAVFAWATHELFVAPEYDRVAKSDAVVVVAGGPRRLRKGIELVERGVAPLLIVSNPRGRWAYMGEEPHLCDASGPERSFGVICFEPRPESTQGEARAVREIAARRNLRSIVVITSFFHVTRTRIEMRRCFEGRVAVIGTPLSTQKKWLWTAMEWPKLAYAETLNRGC